MLAMVRAIQARVDINNSCSPTSYQDPPVDDIRVVELPQVLKSSDQLLDHGIHGLQSPPSVRERAIALIDVLSKERVKRKVRGACCKQADLSLAPRLGVWGPDASKLI